MLFYVYLGTTAFVWVESLIHHIYLERRLKKEGYKYTGNNYFSLFDVLLGGLYLVALSTPILHLIFPISHIDKDRSYDYHKNYLEEAGAIEKDDDVTLTSNEISVIKTNNTKLIERTNREGHIYYSPMYRGEEDTLIEEKGYTYKKVLK